MRRDLAILFGIPLVLVAGLVLWWAHRHRPYTLPQGEDLYATVSGDWDWNAGTGRCDHPHEITFDSLHHVMMLTESFPFVDARGIPAQIVVYDITEHEGAIRGQIRGETRLTSSGTPVAWDLVLRSHDSYQWRRTDLPPYAASATVERCRPDQITPALRAALDHPEIYRERYVEAIRSFQANRDPHGRVWAISQDLHHYLAAPQGSGGPARLFLLAGPDSTVAITDSTAPFPKSDHVELISRAVAGREVILAEPMQGPEPQGLVGFELDGEHLRPLDLPKIELAGPAGPRSLLGKVTVTRTLGLYQLQVDGDLIVDPGGASAHYSCRTMKLAGLLLQQNQLGGWSIVNGKDAPRCDTGT